MLNENKYEIDGLKQLLEKEIADLNCSYDKETRAYHRGRVDMLRDILTNVFEQEV